MYEGLLKSEIPWNGKKTVAVRMLCIMPGYCSCGFVFLGQVGHVVAKRLKVEVETPGTLPELVGEESQIQGDGPDAERNIEREGFVLPARNGREGQRAAIHTGTFARVGHAVRFFARGGGGYVRHGEWREVQGEHTLPPYLFSECGLTHIDLPERLDTIAEGALGATDQ